VAVRCEAVDPLPDAGDGVGEQADDERPEYSVHVVDRRPAGVAADEVDVPPVRPLDARLGLREHLRREVDADDRPLGTDALAEVAEVRARATAQVDDRVARGQRE